MMKDRYRNFKELSQNEKLDKGYRIHWRKGESDAAIIAPHGGSIEPGTMEIADAVAGKKHSFYAFEGIKPSGNEDLHLTSTNFDEPHGVNVVKVSIKVLAFHGCSGSDEIVYIGGLDTGLKGKVIAALTREGFKTREHDNPELQGNHKWNICNRGKKGQGVQLELSFGLRRKMFYSLKTGHRHKKTALFEGFVLAIQTALGD